jgi:hypothetical protein
MIIYNRNPVFNSSTGRYEIPNQHDICSITGKLIVTKDNPYYCDREGWIYPWHLKDAGIDCKLTATISEATK